MTKPLNVFFSIDERYIPHFTVAVTSLLENNRELAFRIFVINNITNNNKLELAAGFIKERYGVAIHPLDISKVDFSRFTTNEVYTSATYYRLFLPEILPPDVEDGLVLDSDLVVTGSISELANMDMSGRLIAAAPEAFVEDNVKRLRKLGMEFPGYFNAGVLLVNIKAWREKELTKQFLTIADRYMKRLEWYDQDILNIYFRNSWTKFDRKYNAVHLTKEMPEMPVIVHYASYSKPWHYLDTHPYNYLYQKYLKITPYRQNRPEDFSFHNFILKNGKLVKRYLRKARIIN